MTKKTKELIASELSSARSKPGCVKCGSKNVRIMGQATLSVPIELYGEFSKKNLRRKDCYLMGVNWETFDFICENPKCNHVVQAYGNYVSRLQKENEQLKAKLKRGKNV